MDQQQDKTVLFRVDAEESENKAQKILLAVYGALKEKGYNPLNQLVGYLLSGDPAYITNHMNARSLIRQAERDELLEELVGSYLQHAEEEKVKISITCAFSDWISDRNESAWLFPTLSASPPRG
jgi:uncharacterized protein (UPF0297 family)